MRHYLLLLLALMGLMLPAPLEGAAAYSGTVASDATVTLDAGAGLPESGTLNVLHNGPIKAELRDASGGWVQVLNVRGSGVDPVKIVGGSVRLTALGQAVALSAWVAEPVIPAGPFANDLEAAIGGVRLYETYLKTGGALGWRAPPSVDHIAMFGDSITEQGYGGLTTYYSMGFGVAARVLGGSKWDPQVNGSVMEFASGTKRSDELITLHLASVLASGADAVIEQSGINDCAQSVAPATIAANRLSIWTQCRAAGIYPIATEITPVTLNYTGNSTGTVSARIVAANVACKAAALANNIPWVEWNYSVETTAGTGILDPLYTDDVNDHIHPNRLGAFKLGRVLNGYLARSFTYTYDPFADTDWETPNVVLAGSSGSPTGWSFSPAGMTVNSKTTVEGGTYDWWRFDVTQGASSSNFAIDNFTNNLGGAPAGKLMESVCEVQVISGTFEVSLSQPVIGGTGQTYDLAAGMLTGWGDLTAADGPVVLRTPAATIGTGATLIWPQVNFRAAANTSGVIQFRRIGTRVR